MHSLQNVGHVSTRAYFHPMFQMWGRTMPPMTHVLFLHEFMGMPCHTLSHSKFMFFKKQLSWKRCTYFIHYYIEHIWPLTCWLFVLCCLSTIFFCVNFQKMRKIKLKREYSIVDFPFFVGKKLPNFENKTRKNFAPFPLCLCGFGYRLP